MFEAGDKGLRLLSLDGGGIRGLSELIVLREIMRRIKVDENLASVPRPCEYFDLIGGTSTGGLIALMLGRLRLTIDDAISQYTQFGRRVFSEKKWAVLQDGTYKATNLENAVKDLVRNYGVEKSENERMLDPRPEDEVCKTFVCAMPALNMGSPRIFRTYEVRSNQGYNCEIWQAARATSAAPMFFKRIRIGENGAEEEFIDAGLGCNNPVRQVLEEAEHAFGQNRHVACVISIGTGQRGVIGLRSPDAFQRALPYGLITALERIATDCHATAEDIQKRFKNVTDFYFRFNVEQGLQGITLAEWEKLGEVIQHTIQYIEKQEVNQKIDAAVHAIKGLQAVVNIAELNGPNLDRINPEDHLVIVNWLSSVDFKQTQGDLLELRADDTGQWLLESQGFRDWLAGETTILWCSGMPGAGKTMLAAIAVDHLQTSFKDKRVAVACIFCNYKDRATQNVPELLASILKQIVEDCPAPSESIKTFYKTYRTRRPKLADLTTMLQLEIRAYSKVFIIVDALDECLEDVQGDLITRLESLAPTVYLMVTSRPLDLIQRRFPGVSCLDINANNEDMRKYIQGRILREWRLRELIETDHFLEGSIADKIVVKASGMFLLAKLHMDSLASKVHRGAIYDAVESLPTEVNATYAEAVVRIKEQKKDARELAERVLGWIVCAYRPLSLEELQYALAVSPDMTSMDSRFIVPEHVLTSVCAGLVAIDENSNIIRLVHYSAQEYFETSQDSLFPNAQAQIAATCLTYLSFDAFANGYHRDDREQQSRIGRNPFLKYAASHWGHHAHGEVEETIQDAILWFLDKKPNVACASQVLFSQDMIGRLRGYSQRYPNNFSGVHLLSFFGLEMTVRYQLATGREIGDLKDDNGRSPLSYAAEKKRDAVVELLVACADIDVNSKDETRCTPLMYAAENGHENVVGLLLARDDIQVNSKDSFGDSPLSLAAKNGHIETLKLLLTCDDIDVNSKDEARCTPLMCAIKNRHEVMVGLLLARDDIQVNLKDSSGDSPLSLVAKNGDIVVMRLLLARHDIEVNLKNAYGQSPLSIAVEQGHDAVARQLLARDDIQVNSKDLSGRSPLSFAAGKGYDAIVALLLAQDDIEVRCKDSYGDSPLLLAVKSGHEVVVALLLVQDGVEVNLADSYGYSPLLLSAKSGNEVVVALILTQDNVEVNSKDSYGRTSLSYAAENGDEVIAALLLTQDDIEVHSKDSYGDSPLSLAARNKHDAVVKLLSTRTDIGFNWKNLYGCSVLLYAAERGHEAILRPLLARNDIEVNSRNSYGRSPLMLASEIGHETVVMLLLARDDIDVNAKDLHSRTALSYAAESGHESIVTLLLAREEIEVNSSDSYGRSPLLLAAKNGHGVVVTMLQSRMHFL